jgi:hypothetical protein
MIDTDKANLISGTRERFWRYLHLLLLPPPRSAKSRWRFGRQAKHMRRVDRILHWTASLRGRKLNAATSERARSRVFDPGFATSSKGLSFAGIVASILAAAFAASRAPE